MSEQSEVAYGPVRERIAAMMTGFQPACVIGAAAELDIWATIGEDRVTVEKLAERLECDDRALRVLLDALAAIKMLRKEEDRYSVDEEILFCLGHDDASMLPMARHWLTCLRAWSQLARTVQSGAPTPRVSGILGPAGEREAFIHGMHSIASMTAGPLIDELDLPPFNHVLDVGGATGSYTLAFLRKYPNAKATLFDLPDAVEAAQKRIAAAGMSDRVALVSGDFYEDELPPGANLAWVSAIIHQNNREQNRTLFTKIFRALPPGSHIAIRDIVMESDRTEPAMGALFAVNMLANTPGGGTYTLEEITEDLESAGFANVELVHSTQDMNCVVTAGKG